jgi:hypothetical protein
LTFLVNFSKPCITFRCQNADHHEIENLELEIIQSDLGIRYNSDGSHHSSYLNDGRICFSDKLLYKSYIDANCYIHNYTSGYQSVKILATFRQNGTIKHCSNFSVEINLPKLWDIGRFDFRHNSSDLYSLEISPDFSQGNINTLSFGYDFDGPDFMDDFNYVTLKIKLY